MSQPPTLERLASTWAQRLRGALAWFSFAVCVLLLLGAAQLARGGTLGFRIAAGALVAGALAVFLVRWAQRRRTPSLRRTIQQVLGPTAPEVASSALRAVALVEKTEQDPNGTSAQLAHLHFDRVLARTSEQSVLAAAKQHAGRYTLAAGIMLAASAAMLALGPMRVVEGMGVLLAREGRAPVHILWLQDAAASVRFPRYLHLEDRLIDMAGRVTLPAGSEVTIRGKQRYPGRTLVLSDGAQEIPFVADANGDKLARITLAASAPLWVAARFGTVLVHEPRTLDVVIVPDQAPRVELQGAPRVFKLMDITQLEMQWRTSDDHGLKQIDLVLRTGTREERRSLASFDGDVSERTGAYNLARTDAFLSRAFFPVTVSVEARDTNPDQQASWGKSESFVIIPPAIGEPEARRYALLLQARAVFVDRLATLEEARGVEVPGRAPKLKPKDLVLSLRTAIDEVMAKAESSTVLPSALRFFITSQIEALQQSAVSAKKLDEKLRLVTLAIDAAGRRLSQKDSQKVAIRLGDVAEEVAVGARVALESEQRARGVSRVDEGLTSLQSSVAPLSQLGDLGRDLGEVLRAGSVRIARARSSEDLYHTELAALHLAARLRRPTPSFSASSNKPSGGGGGGESGGGASAPQSESASQDDEKFEHLAEQLSELVGGHQDNLNEVERALQEAMSKTEREEGAQEAKQRAEALRHAVENLPEPGQAAPGSSDAAAALAREHTGAMAQGLEGQDMQGAVDSAKDALGAFEEAERHSNESPGLKEQLQRGKDEVKKQLEWAKQKLAEQQQQAVKQAQEALQRAGGAEQELARRASELAAGDPSQVALPQQARQLLEQAQRLMDEAARKLAAGDAKDAIMLQREAQRLLEQSAEQPHEEPGEGEGESTEKHTRQSGGDEGLALGGDVPGDAQARAEEFRRRVLEGLGQGREGPLAPAVKRYAEGLLK